MRRRPAPDKSTAPDPPPDWAALRTLWPYLTEFPGRVLFAVTALIAAKVMSVTLPLVLKHVVDSLDGRYGAIVVPVALLAWYCLLRFGSSLLSVILDVVFGRVTERAMRRAGLKVFEHLHRLDLDFHLSRRTGGLSRDIERGVNGISFLLRFMLFNIVPTLLEIAMVAGILLFNYGSAFAWITLGTVVIYIAFSVLTTEWRTKYVREANQLDSRANTRAVDSLLNYETVKYFGNEAHESAEYDRFLADWERAQQQNRASLGALNAGQQLIVAVAVTWMMFLSAQNIVAGRMTLGDFTAVNAYILQLFVPLNFLGFIYREIRRALTDMSRMFGLMQQQPKVSDAPGAQTLQAQRVDVKFENVSFGYSSKRQILDGVSFEIPAGRKLAVVGASGAGKSTLARLLFRFYDTDAGGVTLNGVDVRDMTQASLRQHIGVVPQDTVLFNDSIEYNIRYGRPQASREEVEQAAKLAHLDHFIANLPDGYDTVVGERGLKVSGGEKQRIAIARALLKNPPVMIFDEATSSLDSGSEQAILAAIREVAAHRTTLVVAHRLSTITDADEIVYLEKGRVKERGTHAELLAAEGGYARLWRMQQREKHDG